MFSRIAAFLCITLLATGCYLPVDFETDINIDNSGKYAFRYKGDMIAVTLLSKISKGKVEGEKEIKKQAAIYKRDLERDSGFKKVEHKKFARYEVFYEHQGNIHEQKSFDFVRSNARFLAINRRSDGLIEIIGDRPPKKYVEALIERGVDARGVVRVWTNNKVMSHNAHEVREGSPALYQSNVRSMREPTPSIIMQLQ